MTPEDLETRLGNHPASSGTVATVLAALRADPDWTVGEVEVDGWPVAIELLHHPSGRAYTLSRRRGSTLGRRARHEGKGKR